jgi:hypothetical protein
LTDQLLVCVWIGVGEEGFCIQRIKVNVVHKTLCPDKIVSRVHGTFTSTNPHIRQKMRIYRVIILINIHM